MANDDLEKLTFEAAFHELEETVRRLAGGELPLDESIALFERGQRLAEHCGQVLDRAELKVSKLEPSEDTGYEAVPFESEAGI